VPEQQGNTNKSAGEYPAVTEGQNLVVATHWVATYQVTGVKTKTKTSRGVPCHYWKT